MAVSFVGAGSAVNSADALSVPWPGSQSAGDIGLLLLETNETDTVSVSGVTELASSPQYHVAQAHRFSVFWVEATGSDANISIPDPGNHGIAQMLVFSGVDTTAPINVTVGTSPGEPSASVTCAGVTTTVDGCGIVHIVGTGRDGNSTAQFDSWANANLASITEIADVTTGTAGGGGFGAAWGIKTTAGATGDCTVTQAVSAIYTTITVALEPAGGSGAIAGVSDITLGAATVSSAGAVALKGALSATLGAATLVAVGVLAVSGSGTLTRTLDNANLVGTGKLAIAGAVSATLSPATITATSELVTPGGGSVTATLADATIASAGKLGIAGTLSATLLDATLTAEGSAPSEVTLSGADLLAIADAVWGHADAIAAHAALDDILARVTC